MFETRVTELSGIEYPIIQGALGGGLSRAGLVSAVSNAGAMGIISQAKGIVERLHSTGT